MGSCSACQSTKPISETPKQKGKKQTLHIQAQGQTTTLIIILQESDTLQLVTQGIYITDSTNTILKGIATGLTQVTGEYQAIFTKKQCSKAASELDIFMREQVFSKGSAKKGAHFLSVGNYIQLTGSGQLMASALQALAKLIDKEMQQVYFQVKQTKLLEPLKSSLSALIDSAFFNQTKMLFLNSESEILDLQQLFSTKQLNNFSKLQFISLQNECLTLDSFLYICQ